MQRTYQVSNKLHLNYHQKIIIWHTVPDDIWGIGALGRSLGFVILLSVKQEKELNIQPRFEMLIRCLSV